MSELFPDYRSPWETDDQALLRKHAAEFFRKEATPNQDRWAAQHQVDREFWTKAGAAGLLCLDIAEEYGGGGGNFGHEAIVQQEIAYAHDTAFGFAVHSTIVAHYIAAYATEDQKKRWLSKCASGESVLAIAMTEPGTGSDLQAVRTTAVRDGGHYVINGSKTFISNASHCDLLVIVAKTDPSQGSKGISLLVAETENLPGFERGRVLDKIGQHGQDTRELSFTDMRVPAANLLGGVEGQGFYQLMGQLQRERLILGVGGVAVAEAAQVRDRHRRADDRGRVPAVRELPRQHVGGGVGRAASRQQDRRRHRGDRLPGRRAAEPRGLGERRGDQSLYHLLRRGGPVRR